MSRISSLFIASSLATLTLASNCWAVNGPIIRDCSFGQLAPFAPIDPDFVLLSGDTLKLRNGVGLSVLPSQTELDLTASESVDPNFGPPDNQGTVQLFATVSTPGQPTRSFFGTATGFVILGIPLNPQDVGQVFTISWHMTSDTGFHPCPSAGPVPPATTPFATPSNLTPIPFVVTVVPGSQNGQ